MKKRLFTKNPIWQYVPVSVECINKIRRIFIYDIDDNKELMCMIEVNGLNDKVEFYTKEIKRSFLNLVHEVSENFDQYFNNLNQ